MNLKQNDGIIGFFEEHFYLSNFYPCKVICNDFKNQLIFGSSEAMFQALKCPSRASEFTSLTPNESKILGNKVKLRDNWEDVKVDVMEYCLRSKFDQNPELKEKLIQTGDLHLEESNTWGDKYWGTVNGEGQNNLGKLLMKIRDEYINSD